MCHHIIIDKEFNLWGFGENNYGQLGVGDKEDKHLPVKLPAFNDGNHLIVSTSGILNHTLFLDDQGDVSVSGITGSNGNLISIIPIKMIENIGNILKITSGTYHALFLDNNGDVFSFGNNNLYQLGLGDREYRDVPTKIENIPKIRDICSGSYHSILIDVEGSCWSFGSNYYGQLGLGDTRDRLKPTKIENILPIRSAICSFNYTILININDTVYSFGHNNEGQLGLGDYIDRLVPTEIQNLPAIKSVHSRHFYTIFLDVCGVGWGCGKYKHEQFSSKCHSGVTIPEKIIFHDEISSIICGVDTTIIINSKGECFSFGMNDKGQLGLGHTNDVFEPTKISVTDESGQVRNLETFVLQPGRGFKTKNARN